MTNVIFLIKNYSLIKKMYAISTINSYTSEYFKATDHILHSCVIHSHLKSFLCTSLEIIRTKIVLKVL